MMKSQWRPLEVTPEDVGVPASAEGLAGYLHGRGDLEDLLTREKALVLRGFAVPAAQLGPILNRLLYNRLAYVHGNSPRTKVGENVYTSTEYPAEYTISLHNEMSYAARWPARLAFYCEIAPESGGATPVIDGQHWLKSLDDDLRDAFSGGVRYTQNLHNGFGLGKSWQDTFETTDRDEVEQFLAQAGATWEWRDDEGLQVSQVRPATTRHPVTGAEVWFSQVDQWHPAGLDEQSGKMLASLLPPDELPQSASFADGSAIPDEYIQQIRDRGLSEAVDVQWRPGDLLLIDNVLVGHGRRPFTGTRRVLVAMSDRAPRRHTHQAATSAPVTAP
jgi:alpha-ketoglutarate-dependent taurine dioxygenase